MLGETKQGSPFIGGGRAVRAPILYSYVCFRLFSAIFVVSFLYSYLPFPPFLFFVIMLWVSLCGRGFLFLCFVVNAPPGVPVPSFIILAGGRAVALLFASYLSVRILLRVQPLFVLLIL